MGIIFLIPAVILSAALAYFAYNQYNRNIELIVENKSLEKEIEKLSNNYYDILPGKKALLPGYKLIFNKKDKFSVDYEVDILEVSDCRVKVKAYDYTSNDTIANDPSLKNNIVSFLDYKWIDKSEIEVILDEKNLRDIKLNEILK